MNQFLPFIIGLIFICSPSSSVLNAQQEQRPKVAVVLSGGGAKGFAHIGALKVLEREGLPIDIIVGTSMGAIVGGLYSVGYTAEEIEQVVQTEDWDHLLSDNISRHHLSANAKIINQRYAFSVPFYDSKKPEIPVGAIQGQNVLNKFCDLFGNVPVDMDFKDLPIQYACVGTNLENGIGVVNQSGFMPTAVYSSMAIPGVFYPGWHNGFRMVDGGVANNFPTDVAKQMGADIIVGVDIRNDLYKAENINSIPELLDQLINFYSIEKDSINKSYCQVLIRPDITGFNASSFYSSAVDTLIMRGERAANDAVPAITELIRNNKLTPKEGSKAFVKDSVWHIKGVDITGDYSINNKLILDNLNIELPGAYTYAQIKNAIDRVYGIGTIDNVYFKFVANTDSTRNLQLVVNGKKAISNINVGMRINTRDAVSVLLNYTQRDYRKRIGLFSASANISSNPGFELFGEMSKGNLPVLGLRAKGKRQEYDIYTNGLQLSSSQIYFGSIGLYSYQTYRKKASIGFEFNEDIFRGNIFGQLTDSTVLPEIQSSVITEVRAYYNFDNLDDYYFPRSGTEFYGALSIVEDEAWNNITPVVNIKLRKVVAVDDFSSVLLNFYGRSVFLKDPPLMKRTFIGGHTFEIYYDNHLPFYGIPPISLSAYNNFIGMAGMRFNFHTNHYLTFRTNALARNDDIIDVETYEMIWGGAIDYSYQTRFGPLNVVVGYSGWYKKPIISANIGFWF